MGRVASYIGLNSAAEDFASTYLVAVDTKVNAFALQGGLAVQREFWLDLSDTKYPLRMWTHKSNPEYVYAEKIVACPWNGGPDYFTGLFQYDTKGNVTEINPWVYNSHCVGYDTINGFIAAVPDVLAPRRYDHSMQHPRKFVFDRNDKIYRWEDTKEPVKYNPAIANNVIVSKFVSFKTTINGKEFIMTVDENRTLLKMKLVATDGGLKTWWHLAVKLKDYPAFS